MELLRILFNVAALSAALALPLALGMGLLKGWRLIRARRDIQHASRHPHNRPKDGTTHTLQPLPPGWTFLMVAIALACVSWTFIVLPGNPAEFKHGIDKLFGYSSTRLKIRLRNDSPATRQQMITALTPLMKSGGREIVYRGSAHRIRYAVREEVPSHYRFDGNHMEIAMGGLMPHRLLTPVAIGLESIEKLASLPERVPAQVRAGGNSISVELLPHTTTLVAPEPWPLGADAPVRKCHISMQALFPSDVFKSLMMGGYESAAGTPFGEVQAQTDWLGGQTAYGVIGWGLVNPDNGRLVKEMEENPFRIYGVLLIQPPGFDADKHVDCGLALARTASPALIAAATAAATPEITHHIASASVEVHGRFSPWYSGDGWTAVMPERSGKAGKRQCDQEYRLLMRTRGALVRADCPRNPDTDQCQRWRALRENADAVLRTCGRGIVGGASLGGTAASGDLVQRSGLA